MTYYLLLEDKEQDAVQLGEESLGTFYPEIGMSILNKIVNSTPEAMEKVQVINEKNQKLTLTEFFDILSTLTIRKM